MILTPTEARRDLRRNGYLRRQIERMGGDPDRLAGLSAERIRETLECTSIGIGVSLGSAVSLGKSGAWTPPATASLQQWLKPGNWDTASGEISQWHDSSGNARHGTQATGSQQPTATTDGGRVAARFVAANSDHLIADSVASVVSGDDQPFTVAFLSRWVSGEGTIWSFGHSSDSNPNMQMQGPVVNGSGATLNKYRFFRRDDAGTAKDAVSDNVTAHNTDWHYFVIVFSGTTWTFRVDGSERALISNDGDVGTVAFDRFTLGALRRLGSDSNHADRLIHNWMLWSVALDAGQIAAVETELATR